MKRLNEQRHDMAIKCVQLGIYENIIEAKKGQHMKPTMVSMVAPNICSDMIPNAYQIWTQIMANI